MDSDIAGSNFDTLDWQEMIAKCDKCSVANTLPLPENRLVRATPKPVAHQEHEQ